MFNWNNQMRGPGYPGHSQPMMPMSGSHMPYQAGPPQWGQQPGMGMMMGLGWAQANQAHMYPHLLPGMMNMPVTSMMGGVGPAPSMGPSPPSQPPPPLPAEPPPPTPQSPKTRPPTPPPPQPQPPPPPSTDTAAPQQPGKGTKWDQSKKEPSKSTEKAASQSQSKPSQSPAASQTKPAVSPAAGQTKPAVSPAPGQVKPPVDPAPGPVNQYDSRPANARGAAKQQPSPPAGAGSQPKPGPAPGASHAPRDITQGKPSVASSHQPVPEQAEPDPLLVAELEKVKLEEALFVEQYRQWKQQYDDWRAQNQNHPNKEQFGQYLEQWKTYELQMESRKITIHKQKQELEDKLARISAASAAKTDASKMGSFVPSFKAVDSSQESSGKSVWGQSEQKDTHNVSQSSQGVAGSDRDNELHLPQGQTARASGTDAGHKFDSGGTIAASVPGRLNQFADKTSNGEKTGPVFQNQGSGMTDEKGEEDMNLDEEEEEAGGVGIIQGGQGADSAWQARQADDKSFSQKLGADSAWPGSQADDKSFNQKSGADWNSWNQAQNDKWAGMAPGSARDSGWADQTGSHRGGLQEPADSFRGQQRGDWNDNSLSARPPFGSGEPYQDVDSRVQRPAGDGTFGQPTEGIGREGYSDRYYDADDADFRNFSQMAPGEGVFRGGGQFPGGSELDFHSGRGGEVMRGRGRGDDFHTGSDFQTGRGGHFPSGRGGHFPSGRGGHFPSGRGDGAGGRGSEFPGGLAADFQSDARGGMFNNSGPESFDREGGPARGRDGRGVPSLMSFEFNNGMRNQFTDVDLREAETAGQIGQARDDADYGNFFGDRGRGRGGMRERGGQGYLNDDDGYEGSRSFPAPGRGFSQRGGLERGGGSFRGPGGFGREFFDSKSQADPMLGQRGQGVMPGRDGLPWRGGMTDSSAMDSQRGEDYPRRPPLSSVEGVRDQQELDPKRLGQFAESSEFQKSGDSVRGQAVNPDRSVDKTVWDGQPGDKMPGHFGQQEAAGNVQVPGRERARRLPDDDAQLEVKRGRFQADGDRDESRLQPPYPGDRFRGPGDRFGDFRDPYFRDPYADPYAARPMYGYDRPGFDRFGGGQAAERRRLLPAESIDYGHGGIDREKRSAQPAKVIDYGHGQSAEVKTTDVDLDAAGPGDRPSTDVTRGGAESRAGRESQDQPRMSMLRDREASLRRADLAARGSDLPSRYGRREDELADRDLRVPDAAAGQPGARGFKTWFQDDADLGEDSRGGRAPLREPDRFADEEDYRANRRPGFSSRDDGRRSGDKDSERLFVPDDVRSTDRLPHDYTERDDEYYGRRSDPYDRRVNDPYKERSGDYMRERVEGSRADPDLGRDSRHSSSGPDRYSHGDAGEPGLDRDGFGRPLTPATHDGALLSTRTGSPPQSKVESVKVEDLLCPPNRESRPPQIVTIIRGLPGSGKTYVSKLLREKEISCGGSAPRMLCLDDYFMVDVEKEVPDPDTGKKVKKRVMEYEYEQALEDSYRQGLLKSFKKTIDDGFFPFIIVDATNEKVAHFSDFWSYAKSKGFQVYVGELDVDVPTCIQRNVHHWTEWDIEKVKGNWEPLPAHYIRLDLRWLLQEDSIPEVVMEDSQTENADGDKSTKKPEEEDEEEDESDSKETMFAKSKWELNTSEETLDKLDGIRVSKKHIAEHQSLNDYLQPDQMDDDYFQRESVPGKKRVRWADLEEKKIQNRRRDLGFIVGQTQQDWDRITDHELADKALNQTKYFYKN